MRYARAYTYDTHNPVYTNPRGAAIQATPQWYQLVSLLYKLGITVLY